MAATAPYVAIVGASQASAEEVAAAEEVGRLLGGAGAVMVCGGTDGVMAAGCRGVAEAGGVAVGILPGLDRSRANRWVTVAIPTGLGELRNGVIVRSADAVIAIGGAYGTLSEVAFALGAGVPVIGIGTWEIEGIEHTSSPADAVARALELAVGRWS